MKGSKNRSVAWAGFLLVGGFLAAAERSPVAAAPSATNATPEGFTLPAKRENAQRRRYTVRVVPQQAELASPIAAEEERQKQLKDKENQPRLSEFATKPLSTMEKDPNQPPMLIRRGDRRNKPADDDLWMQKSPDEILLRTEDEQETPSIELDWGWLANDVQNARTNATGRGEQNREGDNEDRNATQEDNPETARNPVEKIAQAYDQAQGNVLSRMGLIIEPEVQPSTAPRATTSIPGLLTSRDAASKESRTGPGETASERTTHAEPGDARTVDPGGAAETPARKPATYGREGLSPAIGAPGANMPAAIPAAGSDSKASSAWGSGWKTPETAAVRAATPLSPGSAKPAPGTTGLVAPLSPGSGTTPDSPNALSSPSSSWATPGSGGSTLGAGGFTLPSGNNRFEPMKPLDMGNRPVIAPAPAPSPLMPLQPKRPPMGTGMR